jgi:glycosyltransferase involved in cell wall biosynthesis
MKIMVNALSANAGGGLTYLINLLPALDRVDHVNQYLVLVARDCPSVFSGLSSQFRIERVLLPPQPPILRGLYEQLILPFIIWKHKIDILYSPADTATLLASCPVVLALRNPTLSTDRKIPWKGKARLRLNILRCLSRMSAHKATRIIFVSKASRDTVRNKFKLKQEKTVAIHHGANPIFSNPVDNKYQDKLSAFPPRYILAVSTVYYYKNFLNLIKAYRSLISKGDIIDLPLVIVGGNQDPDYFRLMEDYIEKEDLRSKVLLAGRIDYWLMPQVYSRAELFVFPSYMETFGHPSLEAMISGVPVAAAGTEVMREILGDAAIYYNPFNKKEMAEKIKILMDDPRLKKRLIENGKQRIKDFSWEKTASKTLDVFRQANGDYSRGIEIVD